MSDFDGILLVDKPEGITSAHAVAVVKRRLREAAPRRRGGAGSGSRPGPKVGHLGTLDPFASGLLPLCVGEGTKIAPYLNACDKAYAGIVELGLVTDTLDATGAVLERRPAPDPACIDLDDLARAFTGELLQVPPAYSAIKKDGVRMYELARRGQAPVLEPRPVTIRRLEIARVAAAAPAAGGPRLTIAVECSKGTYIRSLARDIGERIGCGAVLAELRRTRFGAFCVADAVGLADIEGADGAQRAARALLRPAEALTELRSLGVDAVVAARLRSGQQGALASLPRPSAAGEQAKVVTADGSLAAVVGERGGGWRIERVFCTDQPVPGVVAPLDPPC